MKYMGSKRAMLRNGLGELLSQEVPAASRFVDLFTGSAAVACHIAQNFSVPVLACDLQAYSIVLADAVISRQEVLNAPEIWRTWKARAEELVKLVEFPKTPKKLTREAVFQFRNWCEKHQWSITRAYGGHYFSPSQAIWIDALRATLPRKPAKNVALAALIQASSQCAAAPGHTAQPFQPTRSGKPFLEDAWARDIVFRTERAFSAINALSAKERGQAIKVDANEMAESLRANDIVFIDPPYSGVQYSRFYHVLESIAEGNCGPVFGTGRYPAYHRRPQSHYSLKTNSAIALDDLLNTIASRGATVILTFPDHECSNGLSGEKVREIAYQHFEVEEKVVSSHFSSLGGTSDNRGNEAGRAARRHASELMLVLRKAARRRNK
jgi:adenine-specific DNA methylase